NHEVSLSLVACKGLILVAILNNMLIHYHLVTHDSLFLCLQIFISHTQIGLY
ncbi:hypothetical protein ACJX0J_032088, partial [Zea mays]